MRSLPLRITAPGLAAALGGGVAAVLLSMLTLQHPPMTLALGFVAPLPLMIAALGFGPLPGIIAVVAGSIFVGLFDMKLGHLVLTGETPNAIGIDILIFLIGLGLPSWLLCRFVRLQPSQPGAGPKSACLAASLPSPSSSQLSRSRRCFWSRSRPTAVTTPSTP